MGSPRQGQFRIQGHVHVCPGLPKSQRNFIPARVDGQVADFEIIFSIFFKLVNDNKKIRDSVYIHCIHAQIYTHINLVVFVIGVPHMGELPYVWCYGCLLINPEVREDSEMTVDIVGWTTEDILYGEYVMTLWTNFAKFGSVRFMLLYNIWWSFSKMSAEQVRAENGNIV